MLLSGYFKIPIQWALAVIALALGISVLFSILKPLKKENSQAMANTNAMQK